MSEIPPEEFAKLPEEKVYTYFFTCICGNVKTVFKSTEKVHCRCGITYKVNFEGMFVSSQVPNEGWQIKIEQQEKS